jgi:hypothetical protein
MTLVRVRWFDHRCKVNSDEFDRVFWRSDERFLSDLGSAWLQPMRACRVVSHASATTTTRAEPRPQAKEYTLGLQPLTTRSSNITQRFNDMTFLVTPGTIVYSTSLFNIPTLS